MTLELMAEHGVENVRGGSWTMVKMRKKTVRELEGKIATSGKKSKKPLKKTKKKAKPKATKGYCIWCGDRKDYNFDKPMCLDCYRNVVEDPHDPREFEHTVGSCHKCGTDWETTIERPLCLKCWRKS